MPMTDAIALRSSAQAPVVGAVEAARPTSKAVRLAAGPVLGLLVFLLLPEAYASITGGSVAFGVAGRATAAVGVWMAVWWMTEAVHITVTALLPIALFPLLGARTIQDATTSYGHPLILMFLGGFTIALAMERWGLHRRMALLILKGVGTRTSSIVGGFMLVTAGLSMWVSNTATVLMMIPIAISVVELVGARDSKQSRALGTCLLLGIAYAASIGGIGTIIGTPPNLFLVSYLRDSVGIEITFGRWMLVGIPVVAALTPLSWMVLTRILFPSKGERIEGSDELIRSAYRELGPMKWGEKATLVVFVLTGLAWIFRSLIADVEIAGVQPFAGLTDAGIAIVAAVALFVIPGDPQKREPVMTWEAAGKIPWGMLLLFGGGLSLAAAIKANGVGDFLGAQVAGLEGVPTLLLILAVVAAVIFLTEITSNTATTATLVPILVSVAPALGLPALLLAVPATVAASCAFMMPVATAPNALVYGSGRVAMGDMVRAGIWLNLIGVGLITALAYLIVLPVMVK